MTSYLFHFPPCRHTSGLSFQYCNCVMSFIYSLPLHPISLTLSPPLSTPPVLPHSLTRRDVPVIPVCLTCRAFFYLPSQLMPLSRITCTNTCSRRNNSHVHFLIYLSIPPTILLQTDPGCKFIHSSGRFNIGTFLSLERL